MTRREYNTTKAQPDSLLLPTVLPVIAAVIVVVLRRLLIWHSHSHAHHSSRKCGVESPLRRAALLEMPSETLLTLLHGVKVERHLRHAHPVPRLTLPAVGHAHHPLLLRLILLRLLHLHHRVDVTVMLLLLLLLLHGRSRHGLRDASALGQHRSLARSSSDRQRRGRHVARSFGTGAGSTVRRDRRAESSLPSSASTTTPLSDLSSAVLVSGRSTSSATSIPSAARSSTRLSSSPTTLLVSLTSSRPCVGHRSASSSSPNRTSPRSSPACNCCSTLIRRARRHDIVVPHRTRPTSPRTHGRHARHRSTIVLVASLWTLCIVKEFAIVIDIDLGPGVPVSRFGSRGSNRVRCSSQW